VEVNVHSDNQPHETSELGVFKTEPIQYKNRKPNQPKPKPQKTAFGSNVIGSFSYSTAWFGLVCGFHFTNRTKPQHKKNIN